VNIKLAPKNWVEPNALAYFAAASLTNKISFILATPGFSFFSFPHFFPSVVS
jgi:hypothetical protein